MKQLLRQPVWKRTSIGEVGFCDYHIVYFFVEKIIQKILEFYLIQNNILLIIYAIKQLPTTHNQNQGKKLGINMK